MEKELAKIYEELENNIMEKGVKQGRDVERIDWIMAINHMLKHAKQNEWDKLRSMTYSNALKDLKKRMKTTGIEDLFVNEPPNETR